MLKTLEELQAWTATRLKRGRFVDGEDLKQLAQLIENIQHEVSADYVELPKDADGEVWHVGDFVVGEVNPRNPKAIERMLWYGPDSGWQLETDTIIYPCPDRPRHHHTPTVEDVLREFAEKITDSQIPDVHPTYGEAIAEYAQRLQLREVDE